MGTFGSETACKGWIYHVDILLQPIFSPSFSSWCSWSSARQFYIFIYLFISTLRKVVGHERALFIGLLPQKSTDAVVGDYNKHTNTLFWHTNCQQARSRSLSVWRARQSERRKGQTHQHPSPPQTAGMVWAHSAVGANNREAGKEELPEMHQSESILD